MKVEHLKYFIFGVGNFSYHEDLTNVLTQIEDSEAIELSDESDLSSDSDDVEEVSPVAQPTQSAALDDLERKLRERAISSMKKKGPS